MNVPDWIDALDALTAPGGWIPANSHVATLARAVLVSYGKRDCRPQYLIPAAPCNGDNSKPDAAYRAERERDAIIRMALVRALKDRLVAGGDVSDKAEDRKKLAAEIVEFAFARTTSLGLRAQSAPGTAAPYRAVDFAHEAGAAVFFKRYIAERLKRFDDEWGTDLATLADPPDRAADNKTSSDSREEASIELKALDDESVERWGRAWTACTALVPLDWAFNARRCAGLRQIARLFVDGIGPNGSLARFYVCMPPLPTARRFAPDPDRKDRYVRIHAELHTRPLLAQAMACDEHRWNLPDSGSCAIRIPLAALDYVAGERGGGVTVRYRGWNVLQLYLIVLADCLSRAEQRRPGADVPMNANSPNDPGDDPPQDLPPEQIACLARMHIERAARRNSSGKTGRLRYADLKSSDTVRIDDSLTGSAATATPVKSLSMRYCDCQATPDDSSTETSEWQEIGTMSMRALFNELGPEIEWVDLLCVAWQGERQTVLPIVMEEGEPPGDEDAGDRTRLVLRRPEGFAITAGQLREAFQTRDALLGACVAVGLGVFLTLAFDLDLTTARPDTTAER
jgi:hypothetical protein